MKKLTKINIWIWVASIAFIALAITFVVVVFTIQVEETLDATLFVDPQHNNSLMADSDTVYKIASTDDITFKINDNYYYCNVGKIYWDTDNHVYFEVNGLNFDLIPGTQLDVQIITGTHTFGSTLFG